ncbi:hypothetical protein BDN72DRAFT_876060 [Pluteus cervinus]|uniref:Uncharacterized protein n=1 Tax=Pluteus cervinus TaxID=181527 RepID=A0ACD3B555_9AGAR|nr:hypothetical protein BDN72DRAFT_876060 [Pluteus cervinus]
MSSGGASAVSGEGFEGYQTPSSPRVWISIGDPYGGCLVYLSSYSVPWLDSYDLAACEAFCDRITTCMFVDLFYEFNSDAAHNPQIKCTAYGDVHSAAEKTNFGGQRLLPPPAGKSYIQQSVGYASGSLADPPVPDGYEFVFGPTNVYGFCVPRQHYVPTDASTNTGQGNLQVTYSRGYKRITYLPDGSFESYIDCDGCWTLVNPNWLPTSPPGGDFDAELFYRPAWAHTGHSFAILASGFGSGAFAGTLTPKAPLNTVAGKQYLITFFQQSMGLDSQDAVAEVQWNGATVLTINLGFQIFPNLTSFQHLHPTLITSSDFTCPHFTRDSWLDPNSHGRLVTIIHATTVARFIEDFNGDLNIVPDMITNRGSHSSENSTSSISILDFADDLEDKVWERPSPGQCFVPIPQTATGTATPTLLANPGDDSRRAIQREAESTSNTAEIEEMEAEVRKLAKRAEGYDSDDHTKMKTKKPLLEDELFQLDLLLDDYCKRTFPGSSPLPKKKSTIKLESPLSLKRTPSLPAEPPRGLVFQHDGVSMYPSRISTERHSRIGS